MNKKIPSLLGFLICIASCSVRQNLNNVCGTYVDDWSGGLREGGDMVKTL